MTSIRPHVDGADARVEALLDAMTLDEKLAQLVGHWAGADPGSGEVVAPFQDSMQGEHLGFEQFATEGLGQITRHYGTTPVEPIAAAQALAERQRWLRDNTRLGIPAIAHEECLTGLAAWGATSYPAPPAWGATFDPDIVRRMAGHIGRSMRALGIHQGLAPVLDVIRDQRWGRVEETISEDPHLVGELATAYVRGLQSEGVMATLKHFVGYSSSQSGRNLGPVHAGPREVRDILLTPFEMAVLDGGALSVMSSYSEIDGLPTAADASLLTGVLRDEWGFGGTVVSDYFGVAFLSTLHRIARDAGEASRLALLAGVDVELPTGVAYLGPLRDAVMAGSIPIAVVNTAVERVLRQKSSLGLLDADYLPQVPDSIDLDPPEARETAAELAAASTVLLVNDGILPLAAGRARRIAVVGPNADRVDALFGCYAFINHVLPQHPGVDPGIEVRTVREAIESAFPEAAIGSALGCEVSSPDTRGIAEAVAAAQIADVCVAVVGDRSGLFGRGTSGEGCDVDELTLPGVQHELLRALIDTGTPVVVVLITGRAYAIGPSVTGASAVVQAFFPGEEGAAAIARVLNGEITPSGRLPMSIPRSAGGQPASYLQPPLGGASSVSSLDPGPEFPFGFGLSYTSFAYDDFAIDRVVATDGAIRCAVTVRNTGDRAGAEVVQLYASERIASVTRPVSQLLAFRRVMLEPGQAARVSFDIPTTRLAFSDLAMHRVVEAGALTVSVGTSSVEPVLDARIELTGPTHLVTPVDRREVVTNVDIIHRGAHHD